MIPPDHPYHFLATLVRDASNCYLSKYVYVRDTLFDERECVTISGREFSETRIEQEIGSLRPNQEIAFHSVVRAKDRTWHIPMVDFAVEGAFSAALFDRMSRFLEKRIMLNLAIYASGRSFHGYANTLLSSKEWLEFMGRLLLINERCKEEIVDARWIGHRLIGGFASLRWSNNSGNYLGLPKRINHLVRPTEEPPLWPCVLTTSRGP